MTQILIREITRDLGLESNEVLRIKDGASYSVEQMIQSSPRFLIALIFYYRDRLDKQPAAQETEPAFQLIYNQYQFLMGEVARYLSSYPQCNPKLQKALLQCLDQISIRLVQRSVVAKYPDLPVLEAYQLRTNSIRSLIKAARADVKYAWSTDEILLVEQYFADHKFFNDTENVAESLFPMWIEYASAHSRKGSSNGLLKHVIEIGCKTKSYEERQQRFKYILKFPNISDSIVGIVCDFYFREHTGISLSEALKVEMDDLVNVAKAKHIHVQHIVRQAQEIKRYISEWISYAQNNWSRGLMVPVGVLHAPIERSTLGLVGAVAAKTTENAAIMKYTLPYIQRYGAQLWLQTLGPSSATGFNLWINAGQWIGYNAAFYPALGPALATYSVAQVVYNQTDRILYYADKLYNQESPYASVAHKCQKFCSDNLYRWVHEDAAVEDVVEQIDINAKLAQKDKTIVFFRIQIGNSTPLISLKEYELGIPAGKTFLYLYGQLQNSVTLYRDCYDGDSALKSPIVQSLR